MLISNWPFAGTVTLYHTSFCTGAPQGGAGTPSVRLADSLVVGTRLHEVLVFSGMAPQGLSFGGGTLSVTHSSKVPFVLAPCGHTRT